MTLFEYINSNIDPVKKNIAMGLFPCSLIRHYEIYSRFDYYKKAGNSCRDAFLYVLFDYDLNDRTLYRIIDKMQTEV